MNVASDFNIHPEVAVVKLNWTEFDTITADATTPEVSPISTVELSVYWIDPSFQTAIISPVRALAPFATVYLKNADEYDPVFKLNMLLLPTILDSTVW